MTETNDISALFPTREAIPAGVRHEPDDVGLTLLGTFSVTDALRVFSIRCPVAVPEEEGPLLEALGSRSVFLSPPPAGPQGRP